MGESWLNVICYSPRLRIVRAFWFSFYSVSLCSVEQHNQVSFVNRTLWAALQVFFHIRAPSHLSRVFLSPRRSIFLSLSSDSHVFHSLPPMFSLPVRLLYLSLLCKQMKDIVSGQSANLLAQVKPFAPVSWKVTDWGSSLTLTLLQKKPSPYHHHHNRKAISFTMCYNKKYSSCCQREPHSVLHFLLQDGKLIIAFIGFQA